MFSTQGLGATKLFSWLAAAWLLSLAAVRVRRAVFTHLRHVPGPWYASWTNLCLKYHVLSGTRSQYIHSLHETYGQYVRISPSEVSISDLSSVKLIHRVGSNFRKADWYISFNGSPNPGIFAMLDPKEHAVRRRLFAQSFSNTSITGFESKIREKVKVAVTKIKRDALAGRADILKWFTFMASDVIGDLSFGTSFDLLKQEAKTSYFRDLETTMMISGIRTELLAMVRLAECLPIPSLQRLLKLRDRLDTYGLVAIENHKEFIASSPNKEASSLFAKFLDPSKNQELSTDQISAEASNLIVAGSDTTAVSLTYLIWSLLRPQHKHIKHRLLAEISTLSDDAALVEIRNLKYLGMAIDESLRLYGAAPGSLPRISMTGGTKLGSYFMPKDTIVSTQAYTLHRDASIFPDPERFIPERWEIPTQDMQDALMPFGGGSRVCLGIHLAMNELFLESTTDSSMEMENYFLIAPKSHQCEVTAVPA